MGNKIKRELIKKFGNIKRVIKIGKGVVCFNCGKGGRLEYWEVEREREWMLYVCLGCGIWEWGDWVEGGECGCGSNGTSTNI